MIYLLLVALAHYLALVPRMSAGAVAASYVANLGWAATVTALTPTVWWKLDETSGSFASDSSGNGRGASRNGFAGTNTTPAIATGNADTFDGSNDLVGYGTAEAWIPTPGFSWSVSVFLKFTTTAFSCPVSIRRSNGLDSGITVQITTGRTAGYIGAETYAYGTASSRVDSLAAKNDGAWHHVVVTFDNATRNLALYVDGVHQESQVQPGVAGVAYDTSVRTLQLGANRSGSGSWIQWFPGDMDEFFICNSVLTAGQVADLYAARLAA